MVVVDVGRDFKEFCFPRTWLMKCRLEVKNLKHGFNDIFFLKETD